MQVWKIDKDNFYTDESYFIEEPSNNEISIPILIGYVKPKWTGVEWIEGATEKEIQEWKDSQVAQPKEPTEIEILKQEKEILAKSVYDLTTIVELILTGGIA